MRGQVFRTETKLRASRRSLRQRVVARAQVAPEIHCREARDGYLEEIQLAVCGAAYDGIGVPACIASARLAADQVVAWLREIQLRENENHGRTLRPTTQGS